MLDQEKVLARYRHHYETAIDDGHTEEASKIAWEWTWEEFQGQFNSIRSQHEAAVEEGINKAFFG